MMNIVITILLKKMNKVFILATRSLHCCTSGESSYQVLWLSVGLGGAME